MFAIQENTCQFLVLQPLQQECAQASAAHTALKEKRGSLIFIVAAHL